MFGALWQRLGRSRPLTLALGAVGGLTVATGGFVLLHRPTRHKVYTHLNAAVRFSRAMVTAALVLNDYRSTLKKIREEHMPEELASQYRSSCHQRSADRMLSLFKRNGGVYIKAGQHIAAMFLLLPPEYTTTMAVLQDAAPTKSYEEVAALVREELGRSPEEIFEYFERKPIAAASLAQVHYARLRDSGREVAVKIQYPNLRDDVEGDLGTISLLLRTAKWMFPEFKFMWLEREFHANLPKELNFVLEAQNSERVASLLAGTGLNCHVPEIVWPLTTKRVLVMEFCRGLKANDRAGLLRAGLHPDDVATLVSRVFGELIFVKGFVHADPHPGNMLVQRDPRGRARLVLLDHGLYRELPDAFRLNYCRLWRALLMRDAAAIERYSAALGVEEYILFATMLTARAWDDKPMGLDQPRTKEEVARIKAGAARFFREITEVLQKVPPPLLLLFKTNDLLRALNAELKTTVNSHLVMAPYMSEGIRSAELSEARGLWQRFAVWRRSARLRLQLWFASVYFSLLNARRSLWALLHPTQAAAELEVLGN